MFSKQEALQLRQDFWTALGQYMMPVPSAEGERINWVNYKTGEKNIAFRLNADPKKAIIAIELSHKDPELQQLYFEEFIQQQSILHHTLSEEWQWALHMKDDNGKTVSKIYTERQGLSIFKREDWPALISFFKPRMIALDQFWSFAKYRFEMLR